MKKCCATTFILLLAAASGSAVTMGRSPVNEAMRASLASDLGTERTFASTSSDEFGSSTAQVSSGHKSVFKAALFSALVPGGGQYYLGHRRTARFFFAAEALTWLGYLSFQMYGDWRKDDYIRFAATHANAQLEGKSEEFINWVGFYNNIREFNALGRAYDNERPYLLDTPENHWEWQSSDDRRTFRDLRNRSNEAYRRSDFMIGIAVVDRVVSIIDAVRSTSRINRRLGAGDFSLADGALQLTVDPLSLDRQLCLTFRPGF